MSPRTALDEDCPEAGGFRLRPFRPADASDAATILADQAVSAMLASVPHPFPAQAAEGWLADLCAGDRPGQPVRAIEIAGRLAGLVATAPHEATGGLELSYFLARWAWGRGCATAAARRVVDHVLAEGGRGLYAFAAEENVRSLRVLDRLGFQPVGGMERSFAGRPDPVPCRAFWRDGATESHRELAMETGRLILTPPCPADIARIVGFAGDREVAVQTSRIPHPYGRADAESFLASLPGSAETVFAIRLKAEHGALIGCTGFLPRERGVEIGYWLGRPYWGEGLATEAARAVIDLAFLTTGADEIFASARVTNRASRRVLEKCGFQGSGSGLIRSVSLAGTVPVDHFRLDRRTWQSIKAWRPAIRRTPLPTAAPAA